MPESGEALLRTAVAAFNDPGRREAYLELYAPDVILHGYPGDVQGRDGARSFYGALWSAFADLRLELGEVLEGDGCVAARYTLVGVQSDPFYGAPATGRQTHIDGIVWLHFRDGSVVEEWQVTGTFDMLTRLSARAADAPPRPSASAMAAALRWEEQHPDG